MHGRSAERGWAARRRIIDALPHRTVRQLQELYRVKRVSLGVVRPRRVLDLVAKPASASWGIRSDAALRQLRLFSPPVRRFRKIPYDFRCAFLCEDSNHPHHAAVLDWELGALWYKEAERLGDRAAAESVRAKFLGQMCAAGRDTRFYMGTIWPYNSWVILGTFWPPRSAPTLFDSPPQTGWHESRR